MTIQVKRKVIGSQVCVVVFFSPVLRSGMALEVQRRLWAGI